MQELQQVRVIKQSMPRSTTKARSPLTSPFSAQARAWTRRPPRQTRTSPSFQPSPHHLRPTRCSAAQARSGFPRRHPHSHRVRVQPTQLRVRASTPGWRSRGMRDQVVLITRVRGRTLLSLDERVLCQLPDYSFALQPRRTPHRKTRLGPPTS